MKQFLLIIFSLLTFNSYAHHLEALGFCSNKAYFKTVSFSPNLQVQTQYRNVGSTQWVQGPTFNVNSSGNSVTFDVPQSSLTQLVEVRFRYKPQSSGWSNWSTPLQSISTLYSLCASLPIKFKDITSKRIDANTIQITFEAEEDNTINYYKIMVSNDGKSWQERTIVFPNGVQGSKQYVVTLKFNTL
jgi:hypothetical protein